MTRIVIKIVNKKRTEYHSLFLKTIKQAGTEKERRVQKVIILYEELMVHHKSKTQVYRTN